ncbi:MAG: PEGA domain-containing protein [Deltaproteobacteria bacterium]|nr:PEGA domain-containing protein [Deltaproteobacteria bacterium]
MPASLGAAGIHRMLVVNVEYRSATTGAPMVVVTAKLIVTDVEDIAVKQHFCEMCAADKLSQGSTDLAQELLREFSVQSGRTIASIKSVPPGAQVFLDGRAVGVTDALFNTSPGEHVVVLEKPGFQREIRQLVLEEGRTAELSVRLRASDDRVRPPWRPSRVVPGIAIGAGAALLVLGGYGIYVGGDTDDKFEHPRGRPVGVLASVVGAGAIGYGVYRLLRPSRRSGPTAAVQTGGAVLGWTGAF